MRQVDLYLIPIFPGEKLGRYKNTSIPYRGKLFFNYPITDFNLAWEKSLKLTPKGLLNRVIKIQIWAYDAITLELLSGSPFVSKAQAAKSLEIPRATLDIVLDKGRTAGSKARAPKGRRPFGPVFIFLYIKKLIKKNAFF